MPRRLRIVLLAAGLLIAAAVLVQLALALARRRRQAMARKARGARFSTPEPHIVLADYDRLVVTHSPADDTVYVLRPPGADPQAILRVARLVVPEVPYQELAGQLGVPAGWPMETGD